MKRLTLAVNARPQTAGSEQPVRRCEWCAPLRNAAGQGFAAAPINTPMIADRRLTADVDAREDVAYTTPWRIHDNLTSERCINMLSNVKETCIDDLAKFAGRAYADVLS